MKFILIVGGIILGLVGIIIVTTNTSGKSSTHSSNLTIQTIQNDVASGGSLIDVRTAAEYNASHIAGATNLSLQQIQSGSMPTTAKDKPVYVYCHSGNRSSQAKSLLIKAGYQNIIDLGAMTHVQSLGGIIQS